MTNTRQPAILIFHMGSLGDSLVSIPALRAIRSHFGQTHQLVLLHNQNGHGVSGPKEVLGETGLIDEFVSYPGGLGVAKAVAMFGLALRLSVRHFSAVIYLMRSARIASSIERDRLFFRICMIDDFIGFSKQESLDRLEPSMIAPHESERLLNRIAARVPIDRALVWRFPLLPLAEHRVNSAIGFLKARRTHPGRQLIGLCPGCKNDTNRWPFEHFIKLARLIVADPRLELVVLGGLAEEQQGQAIVKEVGGTFECCGALDALATAGVLQQCEVVVGLNTGTTHLAAAVGTRCVAIYSARDNPLSLWEPLGTGHVVLRHQVPCSGCLLNSCPVPGHPCVTLTTPEQVWTAIQKVLNDSNQQSGSRLKVDGAFDSGLGRG